MLQYTGQSFRPLTVCAHLAVDEEQKEGATFQ